MLRALALFSPTRRLHRGNHPGHPSRCPGVVLYPRCRCLRPLEAQDTCYACPGWLFGPATLSSPFASPGHTLCVLGCFLVCCRLTLSCGGCWSRAHCLRATNAQDVHSKYPVAIISYVDFLCFFYHILISVSLDNDGDMEDYDWEACNASVVVVNYLLCISIILFTNESYDFHSITLF